MYKFTNKLQRLVKYEKICSLNSIKCFNFSEAAQATPPVTPVAAAAASAKPSAEIKLDQKYKSMMEGLNKDYIKVSEEKEAK